MKVDAPGLSPARDAVPPDPSQVDGSLKMIDCPYNNSSQEIGGTRRRDEDQVKHLEREEVREGDGYDKGHQWRLAFGKTAHH